jgi:ribosomal protein L7/L12
MNCVEVQKCLDELMTHRDLSRLSPQALEHLQECVACRAKMQTVKATIQLLTHMPQVDPKPGFSAAWQKQIRQVAGARPKWKSFFDFMYYPSIRPVLGAVVLVAVSLMVYQFFYSAAGTKYQPAKAASVRKLALAVDLKAEAAVTKEFYKLKITTMGSQSREVRQLIQNYRRSGVGDVTRNFQKSSPNSSVLNGLKRDEAQTLQKKLERIGVTVEIAPE